MSRILVVGGGIVGLSVALSLARRSREVVVVERSLPGVEASTAAAGILAPRVESNGDAAVRALGILAFERLEHWCGGLGDVGLSHCGALVVGDERPDVDAVECERPFLTSFGAKLRAARAWLVSEEGCVDPRLLVPALEAAVIAAGVKIRTGVLVERVEPDAVVLAGGRVSKGETVLCGGAWSGGLLGAVTIPVRPIRGQLVALDVRDVVSAVVFGAGGYVVPRRDETVVGTTLEDVGFTRGVTDTGMDEVLEVGQRLSRGLANANIVRHWSSFRPGTPDGRPLVGKVAGTWVATGHHRNGILFSALTGELMAAAICDGAPLPKVWDPGRFSA